MQKNRITILSTRPLGESLIHEAKQANIEIEQLSFIETETIHTTEVQQEIENALLQSAAVVFTSMNAVEAVADELQGQHPDWRIYSIGNTTQQLVKKYFGEETIAGTADHAAGLAMQIVNDGHEDEVIFFCGNRRRDELPEILRNNHIEVHEITVYETIPVTHKIEKEYNGILFFSPSAVESFFNNNKVERQTILFAIGETTAAEIKKHGDNTIIISDEPGKENLVRKMIEYFNE